MLNTQFILLADQSKPMIFYIDKYDYALKANYTILHMSDMQNRNYYLIYIKSFNNTVGNLLLNVVSGNFNYSGVNIL